MSSPTQEQSQLSGSARRRTWVVACFATCVVSFFVATAMVVLLERKLLVVGSLSTLGLTPLVYLISLWSLSATVLVLLLGRDSQLARVAGGAAAVVVD